MHGENLCNAITLYHICLKKSRALIKFNIITKRNEEKDFYFGMKCGIIKNGGQRPPKIVMKNVLNLHDT